MTSAAVASVESARTDAGPSQAALPVRGAQAQASAATISPNRHTMRPTSRLHPHHRTCVDCAHDASPALRRRFPNGQATG